METTKKETTVIALTATEKKTLVSLTNKIKGALKSFVTIGECHYQALPLIERQGTIKKWIESELGISETHYYKQVRAYDVYKLILDSKSCHVLPHCESVVRSITSEYTYSQLVVKYGKPTDNEAESKVRTKANELTIEAWKLAQKTACERLKEASGACPADCKPTALLVQDAWARTVLKHFPLKTDSTTGKTDKAPVVPDPLKGKTDQEKAAAILGGVSAMTGFSKDKATDKQTGNTDSTNKTPDVNAELNKLRSELAETKESKAKLEIALRQGSAEYAKTKLFKEVFEAGIKAVRLAAMASKDNDKIMALEDLKKVVGLA